MSAIHVGMKLSAIWFPGSEVRGYSIGMGAKTITVVEVAADNAMVPWAEVVFDDMTGEEHTVLVNLAHAEQIEVLK